MADILCLLYHRVIPYEEDLYGIKVSPDNFAHHMECLKKKYNVIRFTDDWESITGKAVVVTFDDGYEDNYLYAYPILKKYEIPATIFVSTENLGTKKEFWWDELIRLCVERKTNNGQFILNDQEFKYSWKTETPEQCLDLAFCIRYLLRRETNSDCWKEWMKQLQEWSGNGTEGRAENILMSKDQLIELTKSGYVDIGGHTDTHHSLGSMSYEQQRLECITSIRKLEEIIGKKITTFSYPFGGKFDYNLDTFKILEELGIKRAATTNAKIISNEGKYEIPRVTVNDMGIDDFSNMISNYFK